MASYNMPGSRPTAFLGESHGFGVGDKGNAAREFFAKIYPSIANSGNSLPSNGTGLANVGRWKGDFTLSDMLENMSETILSSVDRILFVTETWYFEVCPVMEAKGLKVDWTKTEFRPQMPSVTPPRSRVRMLDIKTVQGGTALTRLGLGFEVDDETLNGSVPNGIEWFYQRLAMLTESIIEGDKFAILTAIMTSGRHQAVYFNGREMYMSRGLQSVCELQFRLFGSSWKLDTPFEVYDGEMDVDMRAHGVPTANVVYIMYEHTARHMSIMKDHYTRYYLAGPDGPEVLADGANAFTTIRGHKVYMSRPFVSERGVIDIMASESTVGMYYHVQNPFRNRRGKAFNTASRTVRLTDVTARTMGELTIGELDAASGRWNLGPGGDGELNTFTKPGPWANASAEQQRKQVPKKDLFHDIGEDGVMRVAKLWGSVPDFNVSPQHVFENVDAYLEALPKDKQARFSGAISSFYEFVGMCENARIASADGTRFTADAEALFSAIAAVPVTARPVQMGGCAPIIKIDEIARDSATGFVSGAAIVAAANSNTWALPPGFGRLSGARFLKVNRPSLGALDQNALNKIDEFVDAFNDIALAVGPAFAHSYGIDSQYATSDMWYATVADMIADCVLLPRRLPVWVLPGGDAARVESSGATQLEELAGRYATAVTAKFSTIDATALLSYINGAKVAAANTNAIVKLTKITMVYAALTMFNDAAKAAEFGVAVRAANIVASSETANGPVGTSPETARDQLLSIIKTSFNTKGTHVGASAIGKQLQEIIDAGNESATSTAAGKQAVGDISKYVRTPLLFGPSQVAQLGNILRATAGSVSRTSGVLVSRDGLIDYVEVPAGIIRMASEISAGKLPVNARPLGLKQPLDDPRLISVMQAVMQIRTQLSEQGIAVPSQSGAFSRSALAHTLGTQAGASALPGVGTRSKLTQYMAAQAVPAASPAGAPRAAGDTGSPFGCLDGALDESFNKYFRQLWESASVLGTTGLHTLVMRLYALTPTNYYKSMQLWWQHNFSAPVEYAITRTLHNRTYPIIRMVPGANTMRLCRAHEHMHWQTDQKTGIFGLYYTYYSGVAMVHPEWIHKYTGIDTAGYMHGMGTAFRDVRQHASNPAADQGFGRDLLVTLVPYGIKNLPAAWNPGGFVSVINEGISGVPAIKFDLGCETFENWHKRFSAHPTMAMRTPTQSQLLAGIAIEPSQVTPVYAEDTLFFNDHETGRFDRVRPSRGAIPKQYATTDLRWVLDGVPAKATLLAGNITDL
jgi:hypothetical protein